MIDQRPGHTGDGVLAYWQMTGTSGGSAAAGNTVFLNGVPTDWHVVGTGDFDANGSADILWHNDNGANAVWLLGSTGQVQQAAFFSGVTSDWQVAGTGDFNADGKDDIIWSNDNGATAAWRMDGANTPAVSFPGGVPVAWTIQEHHYDVV